VINAKVRDLARRAETACVSGNSSFTHNAWSQKMHQSNGCDGL